MAFQLGPTIFVVAYTALAILAIFRAYVHLQYGWRPFNLGKLFHCLLVVFLLFRTSWFLEVAIDEDGSPFGYVLNRVTFCLFFTCFSVLPLKWAHILFQSKPRVLYLNIAALNSVIYFFALVYAVITFAKVDRQPWFDIISVTIGMYSLIYALLYGIVGGMILQRVKKFPATVTNIQRTVIQLNILLIVCIMTFLLRAFLFCFNPFTGKHLAVDQHVWLLLAYVIPDALPAIIQLYVMRQPVISKAEWETLEEAGSEATFTGRRKRRVTVVNEIDRLAHGYRDGEWGRSVEDWAGAGAGTGAPRGNDPDDEEQYDSTEMDTLAPQGFHGARKVSTDGEESDEDVQTVSSRPVRLRGTAQSPLTILQYPVVQNVEAPYLLDANGAQLPVEGVKFLTVSCSSLPAKSLVQVIVYARPCQHETNSAATTTGAPLDADSTASDTKRTDDDEVDDTVPLSSSEVTNNTTADHNDIVTDVGVTLGDDNDSSGPAMGDGSDGHHDGDKGGKHGSSSDDKVSTVDTDVALIDDGMSTVDTQASGGSTATAGGSAMQRSGSVLARWYEVARTEVSVNNSTPSYLQLIPMLVSHREEVDDNLELKFVVSRVNPSDLQSVTAMATMRCSASDVFHCSETASFSKPLIPVDNQKIPEKERLPMSAFVSVELPKITPAFAEVFLEPGYTVKCYLFETAENVPLPVMERMDESVFAFPIAYDVLLLRWPYWEERLKALEDMLKQEQVPSAAQHQHIQGVASALGMGAFLDEVKNDLDAQQAREHIEAMHHYVKKLLKTYTDILPLYQSYVTERKAMQFKPSVYKDDPKLRMVATNLHSQEMLVDRVDEDRGKPLTSYVTVTTGAPAAHVYGFKDGGLRQQEEKIKKINQQLLIRKGRALTPSRADHLEIASLSRRAEALKLTLVAREDVVISQALSALATVFALTVQDFLELPHILKMYSQVGFLVCWESLLSTSGDEKGMLGDIANSMKLLRSLHFRLIDAKGLDNYHAHSDAVDQGTADSGESAPTRRKVPFVKAVQVLIEPGVATASNGRRSEVSHSLSHLQTRNLRAISSEPRMDTKGHARHVSYNPQATQGGEGQSSGQATGGHKIVLELAINSDYFSKLPLALRGTDIKTHLMLFTQGINEQQTIANAIGSAAIQSEINNASWAQMKTFYSQYKAYRKKMEPTDPEAWAKEVSLLQLEYIIDQFESTLRVSRSGKKNTAVLTESEDLARALRGGRLTSCKSAKDRTSMAVTIEQARILHREHKLARSAMGSVADVMRSAGVRLINAFKNTGKEKYAFNSFQLKFLPRMYRPEALAASDGVKT